MIITPVASLYLLRTNRVRAAGLVYLVGMWIAFTAIIVPPQAGILAVGAITDRVVAVDGMIGVRPMLNLTLSSDHRLIDGASAARFLNDVVVALGDAGKLS